MSGYRNGAAVDADNLFDTDIVGDGPQAENFRLSNGVGLKYAAAPYGTPGPSFGYRNSAGVDNGPRWTTKGTAVYSLPINGKQYNAGDVAANRQTAQANIYFNVSADGTYNVTGYRAHAAASGNPPAGNTVNASGTWNTFGLAVSAVQVAFSGSWTLQQSSGTTSGSFGSASNWLSCSAAQQAGLAQTVGFQGGSKDQSGALTIQFRNASTGQVLSTTTITLHCSVDGSV